MKIRALLIPTILFMVGAGSCKKAPSAPDNEIYINGLDQSTSVNVLLAPGAIPVTAITIGSIHKTKVAVSASIRAAPEMVDAYNAVNHTSYLPLPAISYKLSTSDATINEGSNLSDAISLVIPSLDSIKFGQVYLLPVTIAQAKGLPVLEPGRTAYYVVRIGLLETCASLNKNHFTAPAFSGSEFQNMTAISYQARICPFHLVGPAGIMGTDHGSPPGMEMRFGDYGEQNNQFYTQINTGGGSIAPAIINTGVWYNLTTTYDGSVYKVYVNGDLIKSGSYSGSVDLTQRDFTFGFCYDESYNFDSWIGECRVWSKVLTQQEIIENACQVDPQSPGLEGYWKFNEGTGNIAVDVTRHGHDAVASYPVTWIVGQICQ